MGQFALDFKARDMENRRHVPKALILPGRKREYTDGESRYAEQESDVSQQGGCVGTKCH
jgi:hypothetical protein